MKAQTHPAKGTATAIAGTPAAHCPDCATELVGPHCHRCGHPPVRRLPGLGAFLRSSIEALFDFDARWWRSLWRLCTEPGRMAREFIAGHRGSVHPAKLFAGAAVVAVAVAGLAPSHGRGVLYIFTMDTAARVGGEWAPWVFGLTSVPLMAFALKLIYPWRRYGYLEHLVVALLFFSVVLFIATLETLVVAASGGSVHVRNWASLLAGMTGFLYGYAILRQAYGSGIGGALLRLVGLMVIYGLAYGVTFDLLLPR